MPAPAPQGDPAGATLPDPPPPEPGLPFAVPALPPEREAPLVDLGRRPAEPARPAPAVPPGPAPDAPPAPVGADQPPAPPWPRASDLAGHDPAKVIQLYDAYLVLEAPEGMLVIDQHALHER